MEEKQKSETAAEACEVPGSTLLKEEPPVGHWGRLHKKFLEEVYPGRYHGLVLAGTLWPYLAELNQQAQARLEAITGQMQEAENVTDELKDRDQMEWVRRMNSIRSRAEEIVLAELIYV